MPKWLIATLSWGGSGVALASAIALIWAEVLASPPADGGSGPPVELYWVLLVMGLIAVIAGLVLGRLKGSSTS